LLYRHRDGSQSQVISQSVVRQMNGLLTDVVQVGTARKAQIGRPVAGKTGTTQDYRDAWFLGFAPQLVTGVWVGNDNYTPMKKVTGGTLPTQIWADYMKAALAGKSALPISQNIVYDTPEASPYDAYSSQEGVLTQPPVALEQQPFQPPLLDAGSVPASPVSSEPQVLIPPTPPAPAAPEDGVFDWYEKELNQGKKEEPIKDDTLIDKIYGTIKEGEVKYDYPNEKKRR
jgi:penicillin-binding protein 1A